MNKIVLVTLKNGQSYVGTITKRGRQEVRMTLANGNLNIVPTWAIQSIHDYT